MVLGLLFPFRSILNISFQCFMHCDRCRTDCSGLAPTGLIKWDSAAVWPISSLHCVSRQILMNTLDGSESCCCFYHSCCVFENQMQKQVTAQWEIHASNHIWGGLVCDWRTRLYSHKSMSSQFLLQLFLHQRLVACIFLMQNEVIVLSQVFCNHTFL